MFLLTQSYIKTNNSSAYLFHVADQRTALDFDQTQDSISSINSGSYNKEKYVIKNIWLDQCEVCITQSL